MSDFQYLLERNAYRSLAKHLKKLHNDNDNDKNLTQYIKETFLQIDAELHNSDYDTLFLNGVLFNIITESKLQIDDAIQSKIAKIEIEQIAKTDQALAKKVAKNWPNLEFSQQFTTKPTTPQEPVIDDFEIVDLLQKKPKSMFTYADRDKPIPSQPKKISQHAKVNYTPINATFSYYLNKNGITLYHDANNPLDKLNSRLLPYISSLGGTLSKASITIPRKYTADELQGLLKEHIGIVATINIPTQEREDYIKKGLAPNYNKAEKKELNEMVPFGRYRNGTWGSIEMPYLQWILKTFDYEHPFHQKAKKIIAIKFTL
jgi:hypothetical protein